MTQDKSCSRAAAVKALLIRAWRERWSASQFGTQIKSLIGRGAETADDYGLAEQIIQLAVNGPAPNQLLLSLLDHSLASELVNYSSVLLSVSRYSKYSRPHCTAALLNLVMQHRPYITARGGEDECLSLGTSTVALVTWLFNTLARTVARLVDLRDSKIDSSNLDVCVSLLEWVVQDKFVSSLLYTGRFEDQDLHQEFIIAAKGLSKMTEQVYKFSKNEEKEENPIKVRITELVQKIRSSDPAEYLAQEDMEKNLMLTLQSLISYDVLLQPTSDLAQLAGQLVVIMNIKSVSLPTLICDMLRCCLMGMNDSDRFEVLRWDAFTLLKLHKLVEKIIIEYKPGEGDGAVYRGLMKLLNYTSLLDMTDAKCKANTFELLVKSFSAEKREQNPLVNENDCKQLLAARLKQLEARQQLEIKGSQYSESRDVSMIFKADSTLITIIQTFQNRTTDQAEFENLLSVMFHIVKGSSFDLLLSAAAANGTLTALVSKLLLFNKGCQESMGESNKVAQNRAALFDMTFLMLVYMVQCFSTTVLLGGNQDGFFPRWARLCMAEPGHVKPLQAFKELGGQESLVDGLLQQIMQGEIRTQVIKWNQVCSSVHDVMKEILLGVEMGNINTETYNRLTQQLSNKLCCFPICISSWLVSCSHFGESEATGRRPSAMAVIDRFISISGGEDTDTRPYYAKRSNMMINILKKMKREMEEPIQAVNSAGRTQLSVAFDKLWEKVWSKLMLDISATRQVARLFNIGGPEWFMEILVDKITSQVYSEDLQRCTELVFSMMHLDLAACTLSLLLHTLPALLAGPGWTDRVCYPAGSALARLTVSSLAAVLKMKNSAPYTTKRKLRAADLEDLCNNHTQPVKLRKLSSVDAVPGGPNMSQEQLIHQAHVGLFQLLSGVGAESTLSPKLEFLACILEECVKIGREESTVLLSPLSPDLVTHLIQLQPHRFPIEIILRLFDPNLPQGRRQILSTLCLFRNIKAKNKKAD